MKKIRIIADSTCDLDPSLYEEGELAFLPLTVTIDDNNYLDGEEISVDEVYDAMRKGIVPKTSQIPYARVYDCVRASFEKDMDVIYIAFSSALSGCYDVARMAKADLHDDYPDGRFEVIDSKGGSGATGLIVLQALMMARTDAGFETIVRETQFLADHIEHVFSVDDIRWLAAGGRIPKIVGYIGSKVDVHPMLQVESGRMSLYKMIFGKKKTIQAVADEICKRAGAFESQLFRSRMRMI